MTLRTFVLLLLYSTVSVSALMFMKFGTAEPVWRLPPAWRSLMFLGIGCILYMISLSIWIVIVANSKITVVFPVAVGLTVFGTTAASILLLGETITVARVFGTLLILAGTIVITR